jgi:hypothetical protein
MEIVMTRKWAANVANQGIALIASLLMRSPAFRPPSPPIQPSSSLPAAKRRAEAGAFDGGSTLAAAAGPDPRNGSYHPHKKYLQI